MKEHPIIFSGEMVRAILEGRKTQTRRVIKPPPHGLCKDIPEIISGHHLRNALWRFEGPEGRRSNDEFRYPYGQPGDRLWVRETWAMLDDLPDSRDVVYRADYPDEPSPEARGWRPSIFMPRWASRITLEVTGVRVERVQNISEEDAKAEGVEPTMRDTGGFEPWGAPCPEVLCYGDAFANLWDTINAKRGYPWQSNPWVWVVEFKLLEKRS